MFTVRNMKISFERREMLIYIKSIKETVVRDMTICRICDAATNKLITTSASIRNPIDQYDKLIGKKVALTKVLEMATAHNEMTKPTRTDIWIHFWAWIASWSNERRKEVHNILDRKADAKKEAENE